LRLTSKARYDTGLEGLRRGCTENTRQLILQDLMDWAQDDTRPNIYWLCGMAGTGKTTIAFSFCEKLAGERLLGASYFCSRTLEETRDIKIVLPTIAREFAARFLITPSKLFNVIQQDDTIISGSLDKQITHLIRDPMKDSPRLGRPRIVAFDAFDEFKTNDDARLLLNTLTAFAPKFPNVKFFITSREIPQLQEAFAPLQKVSEEQKGAVAVPQCFSYYLHKVEDSLVKADIERYLLERREDIRRAKGLPQTWMTDEELKTILDRAGKLFIYASTVCSFFEKSDPEECDDNLKMVLRPPVTFDKSSEAYHYADLDTLYSQILDAARKDHRNETIFNVLRVVVSVLNPLPIPSIAALLNIKRSAARAALRRLSAVISIPDQEGDNTAILPFHASFPDFLHTPSRSKSHHLSEIELHGYMLGLCLQTFNSLFPSDGREPLSKAGQATAVDIPEHLQYSCTSWLVHLAYITGSQQLQDSQESAVLHIFDKHILHWIECMALWGKLDNAVTSLRRLELSTHVSQFYTLRDMSHSQHMHTGQ
jgi:hypothetical protein